MSMGWDYVSELRPKADLLFITQMISVQSHAGMILTGEEQITRRKTYPSVTLSATNSAIPVREPGPPRREASD
jgi:hypothetical protein